MRFYVFDVENVTALLYTGNGITVLDKGRYVTSMLSLESFDVKTNAHAHFVCKKLLHTPNSMERKCIINTGSPSSL